MVIELGEMLEVPPAVRDAVCVGGSASFAGGMVGVWCWLGWGFRTMRASFGMVRACVEGSDKMGGGRR